MTQALVKRGPGCVAREGRVLGRVLTNQPLGRAHLCVGRHRKIQNWSLVFGPYLVGLVGLEWHVLGVLRVLLVELDLETQLELRRAVVEAVVGRYRGGGRGGENLGERGPVADWKGCAYGDTVGGRLISGGG